MSGHPPWVGPPAPMPPGLPTLLRSGFSFDEVLRLTPKDFRQPIQQVQLDASALSCLKITDGGLTHTNPLREFRLRHSSSFPPFTDGKYDWSHDW